MNRKLAAILCADAVGYSLLMGRDEVGALAALNARFELMRASVGRHRGRVVATHGDGLLAEFASVVDAVRCAVEIQDGIGAGNERLPADARMLFRIGVGLGDVIEDEGNISGRGVDVASRLEGLADAGGVCVSRSVYDQVRNKLPLGYESLGPRDVKDAAEPVEAYRVLAGPATAGKAADRPGFRRWQTAALAVGAALLLAAGGLALKNRAAKTALPLPDKPSIAVLAFENMTGDPAQGYFADGFTEQLITSLSKISSLFVISRNSAFTYKGKPVKVRKASEDLGVRYVLEGSIQKSGDRVRITAQLIDAVADKHLWSESYDRRMEDIFALQDEITLKILTALQVSLTHGEQTRVWAKGTKNLDAYLKLMEARELFVVKNAALVARARQLVEEALAIDPTYARAYMYMGAVHMEEFLIGTSKNPKESMTQAIEWTRKALAMDDSLAEAHARLGHLYTFVNRHEEAIAEAEKAMAMEPNSAVVHFMAGCVLRFSGRPAESIEACKKSIRLEPFTPGLFYGNLGMAYFQNRTNCEEAVKACEKALERAPEGMIVLFMATTVFSECGREEDARRTAKELLRISPTFSAESFAKRLPQNRQEDKDRIVAALRKAGL